MCLSVPGLSSALAGTMIRQVPTATTPSRAPIRKLPPLLVNQIAAGEVVERPSSVVKELVENALDAGSRRIVVEIEQGGVELIRITDDGCGIPPEELPLAIAPHATSKIAAPEDLDRIGTMGFRGEAIASIASVSRLSIRSRAAATSPERSEGSAQHHSASTIEVEGDLVAPIKPASGPIGTCVTVRNLFFNTPARRKFLRTPATEQGHCIDAACSLAIAHPHVAFTIMADGRTILDVPPEQGPRDRALAVLGKELESEMIEVSADRFDDSRGLTLWGLIGLPAIARGTAKAQHVYLNGRPIRDKTVQHAIKEAYRGLIEPGRYPTAVLMIEMDPGAVDVNVHPAKTEVRFRDQSLVHSAVLRCIRDALQGADLTPTVEQSTPWRRGGGDMFGPGRVGNDIGAPGGLGADSGIGSRTSFVDYFRRDIPAAAGGIGGRFEYQAVRDAIDRVVPGIVPTAAPTEVPGSDQSVSAPETRDPNPETRFGADTLPTPHAKDRLLQVHKSYVVTEDAQGLLIVDQHALHERVMFEALLARIVGGDGAEAKALESQRLLVPSVVPATRTQITRLEELKPLLDRIGIAIEPLSAEAVGVHAFPTFLFDRGVEPIEFVRELLEKSEADGFTPASEAALHEVLDMMACKAAIKAGDRMSDTELGDLLKLRDLVERSSNCPHGRPTSIRLTIRELEKRFGRS